ncbi:methylaspartate mutase subunit S [Haloarculaceae archaeon H-GB2-1]|nr:methylaspartate mutase subunit S [Haloarculaceae archaeon H-GB1-1]MEA5386410.1 methylaspartate mutase subunit S [Haloarculaceae archaeon H-GB11]MEA5407920.1 methylaspartate mutase subunit S [Haloarculaceae archaeon H-GB2-1]
MATIVLGVIGSDAHVVGITILEHALEDAGFDVHNLGVQTSQSEFVDAAAEHDADAVLVSSLYGHAQQDCEGFHDELAAAGLDPVTYVGGNLSVGQEEFETVRQRFRAMGFDRVFEPGTQPEVAITTLHEDLEETASVPEHVVVEQ